MLEAGKGPKAALLCAGGSRDAQGCREDSQALTLGHWRWIATLPSKQVLSEMIQAAQCSRQTALMSLSAAITHLSCPSRRV